MSSRESRSGVGSPSVERLETAGLVAVYFYDDAENRPARTMLWPDEADALAVELRRAAKDVRDV